MYSIIGDGIMSYLDLDLSRSDKFLIYFLIQMEEPFKRGKRHGMSWYGIAFGLSSFLSRMDYVLSVLTTLFECRFELCDFGKSSIPRQKL